MVSSQKCNDLISNIHKRSLRTVYDDAGSTISGTKSDSVQHMNNQILNLNKVYRILNDVCLTIIKVF